MKAMLGEFNANSFYYPKELLSFINSTTNIQIIMDSNSYKM